jgi:type IV secretory pathway TraG/TraD family ATPase VirD4
MSPPREGKTGWLASVLFGYPGPVVSTTTKADVFMLTSGIRALRGRVHVFNPQGIGGVASTFRWNPIEGCQEPATAIRRADAFAVAISMKGVEEGSFWGDKARDHLRAFFHAAALAGLSFADVARWVLTRQGDEAEQILHAHGKVLWAAVLAELRGEATKTIDTIYMTMSRALTFFNDPQLAAAVLPAAGEGLDIARFLHGRETLYLIAESRGEDSPLAPLFACLTDEIHHAACLLGSQARAGRLDPPMLMALDEVTQICPVPLPEWTADSGGKGIQIIAVAHGVAQLRARWGPDGAQKILDTCNTKLFLPGVSDPDTLRMVSEIAGEAGLREAGQDVRFRHPIMAPAMIRQLPPWFALVVRRGLAPVIVRLRVAWKDRRYKAARRAGRAVAVLPPAPDPPGYGPGPFWPPPGPGPGMPGPYGHLAWDDD